MYCVQESNPSHCLPFTFLYIHLKTTKFSLFKHEVSILSVKTKKTTQHGFSPDEENFLVDPSWRSDGTY